MSFLELSALAKTFPDGTRAVAGVDLAVAEGEFVVLLGPSGCGKTTTLRMVAGLELPTAGRVSLAGEDVTALRPSRRDVGFVFQFYALYPHLTVRENLAFPLRCVRMPRREREARLAQVAGRLGLAALLDRHPRQLAGGDQQRVALGRAMVRRPRLWLMDEPLGTLDADQRLDLRDFLREQQLDLGVTTLYVTHDQEEAMALADRVVVMEAGRVRQVGTPAEVYARPASLFVADFVGSPGMNLLPGRVEPDGDGGVFRFKGDGAAVRLPRRLEARSAILGVRSEAVRPVADAALSGEVALDEYLGAWRNLHLETAWGTVVMRVPPDSGRRLGDRVGLAFDPDRISLFDADSGDRIGP